MTDTTFATEKIETPAGTYTVELAHDIDPANPLTDWDNPGLAFRVDWHGYGSRWSTAVDTLASADTDAEHAIVGWLEHDRHDADELERRYKKWRAITGSPWQLFTGEDMASRSDWYRWLVLVDTREYVESEKTARATMDTYATYAQGMVTCYTLVDPSGDVMFSVGGFYADSDAISDARDAIEYDVAQRIEKTRLVGAGFVGIV